MERSELEAHINQIRANTDKLDQVASNWIAYLQLELLLKISDHLDTLADTLVDIDHVVSRIEDPTTK